MKRFFLKFLLAMTPMFTLAQSDGAASLSALKKASVLVQPKNDQRILDRKFEQVPAIGVSADGKHLYAAWYSGGDAPGPGNFVTVATSSDGGQSWKQDQLVLYPQHPSVRIFDPMLWRDAEGQMHLFAGMSGNNELFDGWGGVYTLPISADGNRVVAGKVQRLTDGVMSNKPLYLKESQQVLLPVYVDKPANPKAGSPPDGAFIKVQKKPGNASASVAAYATIEIPDELRIHDEPQIVQINGPEFLGMVRTVKGIYYTRSSDYGRTWSPVAPFTAAGPTTSSRFYIGKLKSGNLLLVLNSSTTRNNMTAMLSQDGGKTWPHRLLLDSRENVSYPDADQSEDGQIHVVFDRDRTGAMDILYCSFREDDILTGKGASIFKTRINAPKTTVK